MGFYKALELLRNNNILTYNKDIDCSTCKEISFVANVNNIHSFEKDVRAISNKLDNFCSAELSYSEGILSLHIIVDKEYEYSPDDRISIYDEFEEELYFIV